MLREAMLYEVLDDQKVRCYLCHHNCRIPESQFGFCSVRQNLDGKLYTYAYGKAVAANIDPIEKKPLYHFLPGTLSFSIATAGCNFKCAFCQNWQISQVSERNGPELPGEELSPEDIVSKAKQANCRSIAYTYTEPTIFFEYAYDTAKLGKEEGLSNIFVTNGFMTHEALDTIQPYLDACNVDLKSFRNSFYRDICKGRLEPVLDSIRHIKELGIWLEITTLIVPGQNDTTEELTEMAQFISSVDENIPWHLSRFHPSYQYDDIMPTPLETLRRARDIGKEEGLKFIYVGNVPEENHDTVCPFCQEILIRRGPFTVQENRLDHGRCPSCGKPVAGLFS
ncbi:MAG: AmmeMemoRadiSam system radical SAM enzyme [Thermodesulfobacteriota bacterium]